MYEFIIYIYLYILFSSRGVWDPDLLVHSDRKRSETPPEENSNESHKVKRVIYLSIYNYIFIYMCVHSKR